MRPAPFRHDLQLDSNSAIVASDHIRGDLFRLAPRMPLMWPIVPPATAGSLSPLQIVRDPAFQAPGVAVLRVSAWVPVVPGKAPPSYDADGEANEMIHLAFLADGDPGNAPTPPRDEDFGMTMLLKRGIAPSVVQAASPLASCVSRPYERDDGGMITVRCFRAACGSLIEQMAQDDEEGTLSLAFVIAARSVEEQEPDVAWLAPLTLVARDDFDEQLVGAR